MPPREIFYGQSRSQEEENDEFSEGYNLETLFGALTIDDYPVRFVSSRVSRGRRRRQRRNRVAAAARLAVSEGGHQTLPRAQTESAREAQRSFYCELCSKGYTRMNDYEAHLSSYDHSHKQRLKDMKQMVKDPAAIARARKQEQKADGLISIKVADSGSSSGAAGGPATSNGTGAGGFKKGGFKKTGFVSTFAPVTNTTTVTSPSAAASTDVVMEDRDDEAFELPASKRFKKDDDEEENHDDDDVDSAEENRSDFVESDTDDEGYEVYDPRFPTD